ncbi:hypothetical protein Bca4012_011809 [Brassica carinata]
MLLKYNNLCKPMGFSRSSIWNVYGENPGDLSPAMTELDDIVHGSLKPTFNLFSLDIFFCK